MKPVVAIPSAGEMGSALAARLTAHGVTVLTSLEGRSESNRQRAQAAGMTPASDAELIGADFLLSILPPAHAVSFADRLAPALQAAARPPLFVDCNAVSPDTATQIAAIVEHSGARFVDASIIGFPPKPGATGGGPAIFASGPQAPALATLNSYGLNIRVLDAPVGAASSLKMCYGGLTKGLVALGSALILAAARTGSTDALHAELQATQPELYAWLKRMVPGMFAKSHRWIAEMDEVTALLGEHAEHLMFAGASGLYARLAEDARGPRTEIDVLGAFFSERQ
jgi:3-hydroxyisobutyrate dehydrogenase-like beta-hydroxyacid dehydrogenase